MCITCLAFRTYSIIQYLPITTDVVRQVPSNPDCSSFGKISVFTQLYCSRWHNTEYLSTNQLYLPLDSLTGSELESSCLHLVVNELQ